MSDFEIEALARAAKTGDAAAATKFVNAVSRVAGDPLTRLKALLARTKRRAPSTVDMRRVKSAVGRALRAKGDTRASWSFDESPLWTEPTRKSADATCVFVVRQHSLVTIGVGVHHWRRHKVEDAWGELRGRSRPDWWGKARAWASEWTAADRVTITVEQAKELVQHAPAHAVWKIHNGARYTTGQGKAGTGIARRGAAGPGEAR